MHTKENTNVYYKSLICPHIHSVSFVIVCPWLFLSTCQQDAELKFARQLPSKMVSQATILLGSCQPRMSMCMYEAKCKVLWVEALYTNAVQSICRLQGFLELLPLPLCSNLQYMCLTHQHFMHNLPVLVLPLVV